MARYELRDANIEALSLVKDGANRKRFFLKKSEEEQGGELNSNARIVKAADWSAVYCVVAEPGWIEGQGVGDTTGANDEDVWLDPAEILKAAHQFMRNGALINHMHETLDPFGTVVENAVAQSDFSVNGEVIKSGSWYIAIEPTATGKAMIEKGELGGVSIQGSALRQLIEKAGLAHEPTIGSKGKGLWGMKGKQLPAYMQHVYNDLVQGGDPVGEETYRKAVGIVENWAAGHDGHGNKVSAETQAKAAAAVAEWNKLRAEAKSDNVKKGTTVIEKMLAVIAKKVGIEPEELQAELEKGEPPTFGKVMARRNLSDAIPDAVSALRESMHGAIHPHLYDPPDGEKKPDPKDTRAALQQSIGEFGDHMLAVHDSVAGGKLKKSAEEMTAEVATLDPNPTDPEEDTVDEAKIAELLKSTVDAALKPVTDELTELKGTVGELKKSAEEEAKPDLEKLVKQHGELSEQLGKVTADIKKLAEGGSTVDGGGESDELTANAISHVQKSDPAFAGVLLA